jgi:hypothetical protein
MNLFCGHFSVLDEFACSTAVEHLLRDARPFIGA